MDELLKALAEAVRQGTAFAMPALVGYYIVNVLDSLIPCATFIVALRIITRAILSSQGETVDRLTAELEKTKNERGESSP